MVDLNKAASSEHFWQQKYLDSPISYIFFARMSRRNLAPSSEMRFTDLRHGG